VVELLPNHLEVNGSKTATCTRRKESGVKMTKSVVLKAAVVHGGRTLA
jgi:hypothetical protein